VIYKSFRGLNKLIKSESFKNLVHSEGFQNMIKAKDYKNIKNSEAFQNIINEGFISTCNNCNKEGFQLNVTDLSNVDISDSVSNIAKMLPNVDLSNVDTSHINANTVVANINNTSTPDRNLPDMNDPNFQCTIYQNQINTNINLRETYRSIGDWSNVRKINGDIASIKNQLQDLGCSS
jgi:hypothetical protein